MLVTDKSVLVLLIVADTPVEIATGCAAGSVDRLLARVTGDSKEVNAALRLVFRDTRGREQRWTCPMGLWEKRGAEEARVQLATRGLWITPNKERCLLPAYIKALSPDRELIAVNATGWRGDQFVLPGRTIGDGAEELVLQGDAEDNAAGYGEAGTLDEWQSHVAASCSGNPIPMFAVSVALAGPLVKHAGDQCGGFHLRGQSSKGKSIALRVAGSVWGGVGFDKKWRGTINGVEGVAVAHTDTMLVLDELNEIDPRVAGQTACMLAGGVEKIRARRDGGLRRQRKWRLLFLSSGELSLADHTKEGKKRSYAGQEIRLVDIPADGGQYGAFDALHGAEDGAAFAETLESAARRYYGSAGPAFVGKIQALIADDREVFARRVESMRKLWINDLHLSSATDGQIRRVAKRFSLAAVAGELATEMGIIKATPGLPPIVAFATGRLASATGGAAPLDPPIVEFLTGLVESDRRGVPIANGDPLICNTRCNTRCNTCQTLQRQVLQILQKKSRLGFPSRRSPRDSSRWAMRGLNLRLPPCEGGTLPLS